MKTILVDPNLVRIFFLVIIFLILIMVCALENNYFLVRTKRTKDIYGSTAFSKQNILGYY